LSAHGWAVVMKSEPATPGYSVTRFEVRAFMAALGLDPKEVESITIHKNRAVATLTTGDVIRVHIAETRG
jgi:hypothetical protein